MAGQDIQPTRIFLDGKTQEFLLRSQVAPFLRAKGYQYSNGHIAVLCAPAVGQGPSVALWLGRRALHAPEAVLAWVEARVRNRIDRALGRARARGHGRHAGLAGGTRGGRRRGSTDIKAAPTPRILYQRFERPGKQAPLI